MTTSTSGKPKTPKPFWNIHFSGTAEIAGHMLGAEFVIEQSKKIVLVLDTIPNVQISALFDQFFGPIAHGSLSWPTELIDLSLTQSSIFYTYVDRAQLLKIAPDRLPRVVADNTTWIEGKGLYIASRFSFVLADQPLPPVDAHIHAVSGKGFRVRAKLSEDIHLPTSKVSIVHLSGPAGTAGGPLVSVQSFQDAKTKRGFTLDCDVALLNAPAITAELTLTKSAKGGPPDFSAVLRYETDLGPFKKPELDITWSKAHGLKVSGFPHVHVPNAVLDFASLLKKTGSKAGCGKLADMAMKKGLKMEQHFYASPSISLTKPAGETVKTGAFYVLINGYFKISARGHTVVTMDLPQLVITIKIPSGFKFKNLLEQIGHTIVDNGEQIVEQLWADKAQLGKLMAVFATAEAMKKLGEKAVGKACKELQNLAKKFIEKLGKKVLGGVEGALGDAFGAIASIGGGCGHHGGGHNHHRGQGGSASTPPPMLPAPQVQSKTVQPASVRVTWASRPEAAGFEALMFDRKRNLIGAMQRLAKGSQSVVLPVDPPHVAPGACLIQIKSLAPPNSPNLDSAFTKIKIVKLVAPTLKSFVLSKGLGEVKWSEVKTCTEYQLQLVDSTGATFDVPGSFPKQALSTSIGLPPILAAGPVHIRIRALAANAIASDWSAASAQAIEKLQTPAISHQHFAADQLLATWAPVAGARTYLVEFTGTDGAVNGKPVTIPAPTAGTRPSMFIAIPETLKPGSYCTKVQALPEPAKAIPSNWGTGSMIEKHATVEIKSVNDKAGELSIELPADFSAAAFEYSIEKIPTNVIEYGFAYADKKSLTIIDAGLATGSYQFRIRQNSKDGSVIPSGWSQPVTVAHTAVLGITNTIRVDAGPLGDIGLNTATDKLYVSLPFTSQNQADNKLAIIDGARKTLAAKIAVGNSPQAIAINQSRNQIGAANMDDNSISIVDGAKNSIVSTFQFPHTPTFLAINPVTDQAYCSLAASIATFSVAKPKVKPASIPVQGKPGRIVVDTHQNKIYVANSKVPGITIIDGKTNPVITITATVPTPGFASALALNEISGEIYIVYRDRPQLSVLDTTNDKISTPIDIGDESSSFVDVAVNAATNKIYAANRSGKSMVVIDGASHGNMKWVGFNFSPKKLAVNSKTNEIYVMDGQGTSIAVVHDPFPGSKPSQPRLHTGDHHAGGIIYKLNADGISGSVISTDDLSAGASWPDAVARCTAYASQGFSGWRLPRTDQWDLILANLIDAGKNTGIDRGSLYWTVSTGYGPDWYRAMELDVHPMYPDRHPIFAGEMYCRVRATRDF